MASFRPDLVQGNPTNNDDVLFGSNGADTIRARAGSDTVHGLGGNDDLNGQSNDDTLHGGTGNDVLRGEGGDDTLNGNDGLDILNGGANDDVLNGGGENDNLEGGTGNDTVNGGGQADSIFWAAGDGNDVTDGGSGDDTFQVFGDEFGGTSAFAGETFTLGTFNGGVSSVLSRTGGGTEDAALEFRGIEIVDITGLGGADTLNVNDLSGTGISGIVFIGGDGSERVGNNSNTSITVYGEDGSDFLSGGSADDTFFGGNRGDRISGQAGNDVIFGEAGDDSLFGSPGNDFIHGGSGNDDVVGGVGDDRMTGSEGVDRFRYDQPSGGNDVITDFQTFEDLFLAGVTSGQLDTDDNNRLNAADTTVNDTGADFVITFDGDNSLTLLGIDPTATDLTIGSNLFFV